MMSLLRKRVSEKVRDFAGPLQKTLPRIGMSNGIWRRRRANRLKRLMLRFDFIA
jgi:hypothetical protein